MIVGATFTGPGVGELLHAATIAVAGEVPLDVLWHAVPVVPDHQRGLAPAPRGVRSLSRRSSLTAWPPITETPEWHALDAALRGGARRPPARPVRRRPRARRAADRRGRRPLPRLLEEPGHRRDAAAARSSWPTGPACATASTRCSAARRSTSPRTAPCCTSRCARPRARSIVVDGEDVVPEVHAVLAQDGRLRRAGAHRARGRVTPASAIRNVVNIGIGGSDLGPAMAYDALRDFSRPRHDVPVRVATSTAPTSGRRTHDLDPAETLFIVSSKTFTTLETLTNARTRTRVARSAALGDEPRSPSTSSRCRRTPTRSRSSASTPPTCSGSGTGSAAATRTTRRSACR